MRNRDIPPPGMGAIHIRWINADLRDRIVAAAKTRKIPVARLIAQVMQRYLDAGDVAVERPRARVAVPGKGRVLKTALQTPDSQEPDKPVLCRHNLRRHPGCLVANGSGGHAHGAWWPVEECDACRQRREEQADRLRSNLAHSVEPESAVVKSVAPQSVSPVLPTITPSEDDGFIIP